MRLDVLPVDAVVFGETGVDHVEERLDGVGLEHVAVDGEHLVAQLLEQRSGAIQALPSARARPADRGAEVPSSAIRSGPGSVPTTCENGTSGAGAFDHAWGSGPLMQSRIAAVSATVRDTAPSIAMPCQPGTCEGTRPRAGFNPTSPQHEAGMRIDPPPSFACATANIPDATDAPAPPLEPPGRVVRVPGVAGDAVAVVLGDGQRPELRRVRAAAEYEPGLLATPR